jgi:DNA repair protein RadC
MKTNKTTLTRFTVKHNQTKILAPKVTGPDVIFDFLKVVFKDTLAVSESFVAVFLNKQNLPIGFSVIGTGGVDACPVDIKLISKIAIDTLSSGVIVAHNHPSGNPKPSQSDINITNRIKKALSVFDVELLDHLILFPTWENNSCDYVSLASDKKI